MSTTNTNANTRTTPIAPPNASPYSSGNKTPAAPASKMANPTAAPTLVRHTPIANRSAATPSGYNRPNSGKELFCNAPKTGENTVKSR